MKRLGIGWHPSLAQRAPASHGSEAGLNADETHHLLPPPPRLLHIRIYANSISIAISDDSVSNSLPDDSDRSWLGVRAFLWRAEERGESKDEAGETDEKAAGEDKDRRSARGGRRRAVLGVEQLWR